MTEPIIECRHVWKIFGKRALEALTAIRDQGMTKAQIFERFDCILGVADASFTVRQGEIFWACPAAASRRWCGTSTA